VAFGVNLDGVVRVATSSGLCSGALLADGIHVLTAAHCVDGGEPVTVSFDTELGGAYSLAVSNVAIDPGWTTDLLAGNDLALLTLSSAATGVTGYNLYTGTAEVGSTVLIAGWGEQGTGATGAVDGTYGTRRYGQNQYAGTGLLFGGSTGILTGDFDSGNGVNNVFGSDASLENLGLGQAEVSIAPGDSGGPTFFGGLLVGIHSFAGTFGMPPDIDLELNSSFGEIFGDTRLSTSTWLSAQLVPEPESFALAAIGLAALLAAKRARNKA
jgi:hypothetical protein